MDAAAQPGSCKVLQAGRVRESKQRAQQQHRADSCTKDQAITEMGFLLNRVTGSSSLWTYLKHLVKAWHAAAASPALLAFQAFFFLAPEQPGWDPAPWLTQRWASWSHSKPQGSAGSSHPLTCVRILGLGWGCSWGTRAPGGVPWGSPRFPILRAAKTSSLTLLCPCSPLSPIPEDVLDEEGCPGSG